MDILFLIIGFVIGFAFAFYFLKARNKEGDSAASLVLLEEKKAQLESVSTELESKRNEVSNLNSQLGEWKAKYEGLSEKLAGQKEELEKLQLQLRTEFENIANKILEEKSQKFTEQNKSNLDIILNPLKERIKDFEKKVEDTYKEGSKERVSLKTEIEQLMKLNKQVSEEANNLASALKGDNKMQGNWGEVILEKILENSGLTKDVEYFTQYSTSNEDGSRLQPDVVVKLADGKHIIIDSKVSLVAYTSSMNADEEDERAKYLKAHVDSIKKHVQGLNEKNYQGAKDMNSPDFVLMFIPTESSFTLAIRTDVELFNYAWEKRVVIVSPSTLLATLKTIASVWKQEKQTQNALEIAKQGGLLYDKFVGLINDLTGIGKKLIDAKDSYDKAMNKLSTGKGNLVRRVEVLKELGAKTGKQDIPENYLERSKEDIEDHDHQIE